MDNREDYRKGHRSRMLKSYADRGGDAFEDYQLLEMLLFNSIPRIDVKPIAKRLLKEFGSLENVFSASRAKLQRVDGVGLKTAEMLNLVYDCTKRISDNRCAEYKVIKSFATAMEYFKEMYRHETQNERFAVMLLDSLNRVIDCRFISEGVVDAVSVNIRKFMEFALENKASSLIIAHNHPGGDIFPSAEDISFTVELITILENVGIYLADHIIVSGNESFSMHSSMDYVYIFERKRNQKNNLTEFGKSK